MNSKIVFFFMIMCCCSVTLFAQTNTGKKQTSTNPVFDGCYAAEAGINIRSVFGGNKKIPVIYPFARYEYYNPQEKGEKGQTMEKRCQVSMWTAGLNWYALPNLVIKADYATRQIGTNKVFGVSKSYNSENEFSIGIAYIGWFIKK